jgi:hypothetical protein
MDVSYGITNADGSFALREDAVVALAMGDTMQTSRTGRAYLRLEDAVEILILPETQVEILESVQIESGEARLRLAINGHATFRIDENSSQAAALEIMTQQSTVRAVEGWFAVWSNLEGGDVVTVASGSIEVETSAERSLVSVGDGALIRDRRVEIIPMEAPYNGSKLVGMVDGCNGRVDSLLPALNIRAGTTLGYAEIGYVDNGVALRLMGRTVDGLWYRVQRFSGFGWVLANAVETECALREYPNIYGETNRELFDVEGIELVLLTPFYGNFESDPWFYRWLEAPAP